MKKNFTNLAMVSCIALLAGNTMTAKEVYLAEGGNDANSGLTADAPRASLTNLGEVLETGDVVYVKGFIHMNDEYEMAAAANNLAKGNCGHFYVEGKQNGFNLKIDNPAWTNITFIGMDDQSGFDGDNKWRFFELGRETNETKWVGGEEVFIADSWVKFINCTFQNGCAPGEGGCIYVHDHIVADFESCVFDSNKYNDYGALKMTTEDGMDVWDHDGWDPCERGGAFHFQFGTLTIKKSTFRNNLARYGSAICQTGGNLVLEDCLFESNGSMAWDGTTPVKKIYGGALCLWTLHTSSMVDIKRCAFIGNTAWHDGGAIFFRNNVDGKDRWIDCNIDGCYFAFNDCIREHGGAIGINNNDGNDDGTKQFFVKCTNTSFIGNTAGFYGGCMHIHGGVAGTTLIFANDTFWSNSSNGNRNTNAGHGGCICFTVDNNKTFHPSKCDIRFLNTIVEGNYVDNDELSDFSFLGDTNNGEYVTFDNCIVGRMIGADMVDFDALRETNKVQYAGNTRDDYESNAMVDFDTAESTLDGFMNVGCGAFEEGATWGAAALDPYGEAVEMGDDQHYLMQDFIVVAQDADQNIHNVRGYDITETDGMFKPRGEKPVIGACEATSDVVMNMWENDEEVVPNGIETIEVGNGLQIVRNGSVISCEGAKLNVYGLNGVRMSSKLGSVDMSSLQSGMYIVTVNAGHAHKVLKVVK